MKYMGSKASIAKYILPFIQELLFINNINTYIEPFIGGANMIDKVRCNNKIGSDINKYLIALLNHVKNGGELPNEVSYELYQDVKYSQGTGKYEDWFTGAVCFLAGFNGRGFDGGYGKSTYETKADGTKILRDYFQEARRNLIEQTPLLKDIEINHGSYEQYSDVKGALIYCDPPYANTKSYNRKIEFDHDKFWQWIRDMSKENIVLVSEESAPDDFDIIWEQEVTRSIRANEKSKTTEKLFIWRETNKYYKAINREEDTDETEEYYT